MNTSGEAADQIVRMSLNGVEVIAKITGVGAKNLATYLFAVLSEQKKTKGKSRLTSMIKSGKELKVFSVNNDDLKKFSSEAKRYGILYCAIKDKDGDGMSDIVVKIEDASRIDRIVDRYKLVTVDTATIKNDIEKSKAEKNSEKSPTELEHPEKSKEDKLLDELFAKPVAKEEVQNANPTTAQSTKSRPSEPLSENKEKAAKGIDRADRPSVRSQLKEIKDTQKAEAADIKRENNPQKSNQHIAPKSGKKKSKKNKERS
jgi:hypothetical protein